MGKSKWSGYNSEILKLYRENPALRYSEASRELLGDEADYKDIDTLRTYIKRFLARQDNTSETSEYDDTEVVKTDAFKKYCEEEGIDINRVRSAKFVNHAGQQKFNVVLDYKEEPFDWNDFASIIASNVEPKEIPLPTAENDKALHLYHSDMHIGAWVSDNSMYENNYSLQEVRRRLESVRYLAVSKKKDNGVF